MYVLYCCIISKTILRLATLDIYSPSSGVMNVDLMGSSKRKISHPLSCPKPRPYNEHYIGPAVTFTLPTSISNYMPVGRTQWVSHLRWPGLPWVGYRSRDAGGSILPPTALYGYRKIARHPLQNGSKIRPGPPQFTSAEATWVSFRGPFNATQRQQKGTPAAGFERFAPHSLRGRRR